MTGTDRMVVWLREAMDAARADAEAATWHEDAGVWRAAKSEYHTPSRPSGSRWYIEDAMDDGVITTVDPQASDDEGVARHIARNNPAAVLRRIAADRKTFDEHAENPYDLGYCRTCTVHEEGWAVPVPAELPCATIRNLAEGYGWTEETKTGE